MLHDCQESVQHCLRQHKLLVGAYEYLSGVGISAFFAHSDPRHMARHTVNLTLLLRSLCHLVFGELFWKMDVYLGLAFLRTRIPLGC